MEILILLQTVLGKSAVRCWPVMLWCLFCCSLSPALASADKPVVSESQVKAAMLYNFTRFVVWPDTAGKTGSATIRICVFGEDPFGPALTALSGRDSGSGKIEIAQISEQQQLRDCQLAFLNVADEAKRKEVLQELSSYPVLTVGDSSGFGDDGGMIRFLTRQRRLRFTIYTGAVEKAGLTISSKLLRLAVPAESP